MVSLIQLFLLLGLAGAAITALGAAAAWWMDEQRRLTRLAGRVLGGKPDGVIVARGRNAAAAFRKASNQMLVMRDGGARAVLYPLKLLNGAELLIDDQLAGRAMRDESRRPLDQIAAGARKVTLRMVFDDAVHPEFILDLWTPRDLLRRDSRTPAAAITEGRTWLSRAEALVRGASGAAPRFTTAASPPLVLDSDDEFIEEEELVLRQGTGQVKLL